MLKLIVDGGLIFFSLLSVVFLVIGNIMRFIWWMNQRKRKKSMGILYYYLDFWGETHEYTDVEIEKLYQILRQFEEKNKGK